MHGDDKPGIGGEKLPGQRIDAPTSIYPSGMGSQFPAWLAFDKQVRKRRKCHVTFIKYKVKYIGTWW